jgi:hypothetical protein
VTSTLLPSSAPSRLAADAAVTRQTGATGLAVALAAASSSWLHLVEYRPASRWTHLLPSDEAATLLDPSLHPELARAQVWLLSWLSGQGTPLHDHGESAGAFTVVRGALTERVVASGREAVRVSGHELTAGRVRHFGSHYVHQVSNVRAEPAVSVHVYTPRLAWMNTYAVQGSAVVRTGTERAGVDW